MHWKSKLRNIPQVNRLRDVILWILIKQTKSTDIYINYGIKIRPFGWIVPHKVLSQLCRAAQSLSCTQLDLFWFDTHNFTARDFYQVRGWQLEYGVRRSGGGPHLGVLQ